jgi:hypothetical protein
MFSAVPQGPTPDSKLLWLLLPQVSRERSPQPQRRRLLAALMLPADQPETKRTGCAPCLRTISVFLR